MNEAVGNKHEIELIKEKKMLLCWEAALLCNLSRRQLNRLFEHTSNDIKVLVKVGGSELCLYDKEKLLDWNAERLKNKEKKKEIDINKIKNMKNISVMEAVTYLNISRSFLHKLLKDNGVPVVRVEKQTFYFDRIEIEKLVLNRKNTSI